MAAFILSPHVLILHMHDSSLLTYCICIFQIFHQFFTMSVLVTVTVNCTAGETLILPWKTTVRQDRFFTFFGVAVRFDWIKIGIWLKLSVLNYSSRPKLSLGSGHAKYGVWPGPNQPERILKYKPNKRQYSIRGGDVIYWYKIQRTCHHRKGKYSRKVKLQNTGPLIYISLNHKGPYCVMLRSWKDLDTCKTGGPKWPCIL